MTETRADRRWEWALRAGVLLLTFLACCFPLYDTDFWWHLRTGELILERGQVPQLDWFTFTDFDKPWIDLHWGFQLLITGLYRLGGVNLVILAKAAVLTAAVGIAWSAGGERLPAWIKAALWLLPVVAISGRGYERPEMLSQLFLAGWLWIAARAEQKPRLVWWLPALQLVWVNCHALFVLGLIVGGCYAVDRAAREIAGGRWGLALPSAQPAAHQIIRAGGLVALACFANPYFEEGALFPLTLYRKFTVDQAFYSANIGEFQRPIDYLLARNWRPFAIQPGDIYLFAEIGVWLLTAISFARLAIRGRWNVMRALLFAGFSHLAWEASRNTNIFALVSGVILSANWQEFSELRSRPATGRRQRYFTWVMSAIVAGLIVAVVTGWWNRWGEGNKPFRLGEGEAWFIHDAARFAGQPGFPERAFVANNGQAAVYIYHNGPDRRVFMDGRLEVCTRFTFEVFNNILLRMAHGDPSWLTLFVNGEAEPPAVLLDSRYSRAQIAGMMATPGWRLVFADPSGAVFLDHKLADKLALPATDPRPLYYPPGTKTRPTAP